MAFGDFTVTRASTKNVLGASGSFVSVANNVPAFEFNTNGSYRGLLVEPGATNLFLRSQEFGTTWGQVQLTVTSDATTAPDGTTTADKLVESVNNANHRIGQGTTSVGDQVFTHSFFAKASERTWVGVYESTFQGVRFASFDLTNGVAYVNASTVAGFGTTASIQNVGNGWYRCSCTAKVPTGTASGSRGFIGNIMIMTGETTETYTGDGTSGLFVWQAQMETGSVATSPIVTTAGTASRVGDVVTLASASSVIGQSAGTLYVEAERIGFLNNLVERLFNVTDGSASANRIMLLIQENTKVARLIVTASSVAQADIVGSTLVSGVFKMAGAYATDDVALYLNGASVGTDTSATIPACNRVNIGTLETGATGTATFNGWIRSVALFPTRLDNTTLATLTTL